MLKTSAAVISVAVASIALGLVAPAVVSAQVTLQAHALGAGAAGAGVTVGNPVMLTAQATTIPRGWHLEIQGRRLQAFWSVLQTCHVSPCQQRVFANTPGTFTFRAVLSDGSTRTDTPSVELSVVWAARTPNQLILEVQNRRVAVNVTIDGEGYRVDSVFWSGSPPLPVLAAPVPTGAANWTNPVRTTTAVDGNAWVNAPLPSPFTFWLRQANLGPAGVSLMTGPFSTRGNIRLPGRAGADAIQVFLCGDARAPRSGGDRCGEPLAYINIDWR
jgi:hypothetical protein